MLLPSGWSQIALSMRISGGLPVGNQSFHRGLPEPLAWQLRLTAWLPAVGGNVAELVAELIGKDRHARKTCEIQVSRVVLCCIGKWHLHRNWVSMATLDALLRP